MKPSKRIQQYRKPLLIGMVLFSCIVGGCLFPIVNCNPENPVETSLVMKTIILLSVFIFYTELGYGFGDFFNPFSTNRNKKRLGRY